MTREDQVTLTISGGSAIVPELAGKTLEQAEEIRNLVEKDTDEALAYAIGCSIKHVIRKGTLIHPDSVSARNYIIEHRRAKS